MGRVAAELNQSTITDSSQQVQNHCTLAQFVQGL